MTPAPNNPKIYHITHFNNLAGIISDGVLWSDAKRIERGQDCEIVGMPEIKRRRLQELEVDCHPGTKVGQYVPFYFCPRSIMLYILYRGNHPDINYRGGQGPILHLQADLEKVIEWADAHGIRWAFSDRNAGAQIASFFNSAHQLDQINWNAVQATDWRNIIIQEEKQAEFLVYESFPLELVEKIGVFDDTMVQQVKTALSGLANKPLVQVKRDWYY